MHGYIKKDEATASRRRIYFVMVLASDLQSRQTGLLNASFTKRWAKNGADFAGSGTVVEVSASNQPGLYYYEATTGEVDSFGTCVLRLAYASMETREIAVTIGALDLYDAVRLGMTALPNATAGANNGVLVASNASPTGNVYIDANNAARADVHTWKTGAIPAPAVTGVPTVDLGYWRGILPNNLLSNNVQTHVASMATDSVSTAAVAGAVTDEIRDAVWNAALSSYTTAGTAGKKLADQTNGVVTLGTDSITAAAVSTAAADKIATRVGLRQIENSDAGMLTADDCLRVINAFIAASPIDWSTDAVIIQIKSLDGTKTRAEIITGTNGRVSTEIVDPT